MPQLDGNLLKWLNEGPKNIPDLATTGVKYDDGKSPYDLLDPIALEGLASVLAFGAKKYASWNWAKGISYTRLIAALLRHTFAILRGELIDPESGLPHINHVGCCWMFLAHMMAVRPDMNDLPKRNSDGSLAPTNQPVESTKET